MTKVRKSRRWLRAVIPFAVFGAFWAVTAVAHSLEQPTLSNPGTMAPVPVGADGSSRLAQRLTSDGITIETVTSSAAALRAASAGPATIFVPAPDFLSYEFSLGVRQLAGGHRVVLVKPGVRAQLFQSLPAFPDGERWATKLAAPNCGDPLLDEAGVASLRRVRYQGFDGSGTTLYCYGGAVFGAQEGSTEIVLVGATEPFRNERIGEAGNEAVAVALLSRYPRLIWVDLHANEPLPRAELPELELPAYRRDNTRQNATGNQLLDAFPSGLWAVLLVLGAAAVLLAFARARRLGGPVPEPLPVLVPAAEAVTGRGRLYQRAQARDATLDALRASAVRRIAKVLNPFAPPSTGAPVISDELIRDIAQRAGRSEAAVRAVLTEATATDDAALWSAVADIDELEAAVLTTAIDNSGHHHQGGSA